MNLEVLLNLGFEGRLLGRSLAKEPAHGVHEFLWGGVERLEAEDQFPPVFAALSGFLQLSDGLGGASDLKFVLTPVRHRVSLDA